MSLSWSTFFSVSDDPKVWVSQVFAVVFLTVSVNFILMRVIDIVEHFTQRTDTLWDNAVLEAARLPVRLASWILGISIAMAIIENVAPSDIYGYAVPARQVAFIIIVAMFVSRFVAQAEKIFRDPAVVGAAIDETSAAAISRLVRLSVMITAGLIILQTMGYSISGVLAFGGIGGIAVGFAARDLLANFFGALMIYWDKPFKVGDWIRSPDRNIEGTVEDIGWRLTKIRTFDRRPLYVPNAIFANIALENPSRMQNRRIHEQLGIRYSDGPKMAAICDLVKQMLLDHEDIDTSRTLMVNFNTYAASHLEFFVYCFTKTTDWVQFHAVKQDVLLKVMQIVTQQGAEFAFPTRTLHMVSAEADMDNNAGDES